MDKKSIKRSGPYIASNHQIVEVDYDQFDSSVEGIFANGDSLEEGVAGRKTIDTQYENTSMATADTVRSDYALGGAKHSGVDKPAPVSCDELAHPIRNT